MKGRNNVVGPRRQPDSRHRVGAVFSREIEDRESLVIGQTGAGVDVHPAGDAPKRAGETRRTPIAGRFRGCVGSAGPSRGI